MIATLAAEKLESGGLVFTYITQPKEGERTERKKETKENESGIKHKWEEKVNRNY